jgi:hypothetical protein
MTIVRDDARIINKLDASLTDDARVVIYERHMLIVQAAAYLPSSSVTKKNIFKIETRAQFYKSFSDSNLIMSIVSKSFIPGKPFNPILMFSSEAGAYSSEAPFRSFTLR